MGVAIRDKLTASLEDYLEAILLLVRRGRVARVRDIARRLDVGMSSVTAALKVLSKRKLVNYDPYQVVTLTDGGRDLAEQISRRHELLRRFLTGVLGLDAESADINACRMEHAMDNTVLDRLRSFAEFIQCCPRAGEKWINEFVNFCGAGRDPDRCRSCLAGAVEELRRDESQRGQTKSDQDVGSG